MRIIALIGIAISIIFLSCSAPNIEMESVEPDVADDEIVHGFLTDARDGKTYKTLTINKQTWMAENLNFAASGSLCYDNEPANCAIYGRLYDWETAKTACPKDWHLSTNNEWQALKDYVGEDGGKLKSIDGWKDYVCIRPSDATILQKGLVSFICFFSDNTDDYGFSALPGGKVIKSNFYDDNDDYFYYIGERGSWWTSTEIIRENDHGAYSWEMVYDYDFIYNNIYDNSSLSVRCVKNTLAPSSSSVGNSSSSGKNTGNFTDPRDGKIYKTVTIGKQTWMAENLNFETSGGMCYDNEPANCALYGRLYDWETAMDACPEGWNLPLDVEWAILINFAKATDTDLVSYLDNFAAVKLKTTSGWNNRKDGTTGNGTDDYGFSALPSVGGNVGRWWTASSNNAKSAYCRSMYYNSSSVSDNIRFNKTDFNSVRCIKEQI